MKSLLNIYFFLSLFFFCNLNFNGFSQCKTNVSFGKNLLVNGDFSQGFQNFNFTRGTSCNPPPSFCGSTDGYRPGFKPCGTSCFSYPGDIWIGDSSGKFNPSFCLKYSGSKIPIPDHSPGSDNLFLMVDGVCNSGIYAWVQTVPVVRNTEYFFEVWVTNLTGSSSPVANLQFNINGLKLPESIVTPAVQGEWLRYSTSWSSGENDSATIGIQNLTIEGCSQGVDFGLDDISLTAMCPLGALGPHPDLGEDIALCGNNGPIILDPHLPSESIMHPDVTITWSTGETGSGSSAPVNITIDKPGIYSVCIDSAGTCLKSDVITITDAINVDLGPDLTFCDKTSEVLSPGITLENATYEWYKNDELILNTSDTLFVNTPGIYKVRVSNVACGFKEDTIKISSQTHIPMNTTFCPPAIVELSVNGDGEFYWYEEPSGGKIINTGKDYQTPLLSSTTVYYVADEKVNSQTIGHPADINYNGGTSNLSNYSMAFDAFRPFTIDSVTVLFAIYSQNTNDSIQLQFRLTNNPLGATTPTIITEGFTYRTTLGNAPFIPKFLTSSNNIYALKVPVNIRVSEAGSYRLAFSPNTQMVGFIQNSDMKFPYVDPLTLGKVMKIIGTVQGSNPVTSSYYGNIYDWKINYKSECNRVPVIAEANCEIVTNTEEIFTGNIQLIPNPAASSFSIIGISMKGKSFSYQLSDIYGRALIHGNSASQITDPIISINHLSSGIYYLLIKTDEGTTTKKLVVEK